MHARGTISPSIAWLRRWPVWVAIGATAVAFAGGYALRTFHRRCVSSPTGHGSAASAAPAPRPPPVLATDPTFAGGMVEDAGSVYRNRLASTEVPLDGQEVILLTPKKTECVENCPLFLRVVGGDAGRRRLGDVVATLAANIERLAAAGVPDTLATRLRVVRQEMSERLGPPDPAARPPLRAMFVGSPRLELGKGLWSVGFALYDYGDEIFDRPPSGSSPAPSSAEGMHLVVVRVERGSAEDLRPEVVVGAVEVARKASGATTAPPPPEARTLRFLYGPLWMHFGGVLPDVEGLYLDRDRRVYHYGPDLHLEPLPENAELYRALVALLRRA